MKAGRIRTIKIRGVVSSGIGEGRKYLSIPYYVSIFSKLLKDGKPYPGTLNIVCECSYKDLISICKPYRYPSKVVDGKVFGGFYYWFAKIIHKNGYIRVIVLRPFLSKHNEYVVEVISHTHLRSALSLSDGDLVELEVICNGEEYEI